MMGNALIDELNRLAKEIYNRKKDEYEALQAALISNYLATKNNNTRKAKAVHADTNIQPHALDTGNAFRAQKVMGRAYVDPATGDRQTKQTRGNEAIVNAVNKAALQQKAGMNKVTPVNGERKSWQTQALVDALNEAALQQKAGMGKAASVNADRKSWQTQALVDALNEAERKQRINTGNVYEPGTFGYSVNTLDPMTNDYQGNLALSEKQIQEYFNSHRDEIDRTLATQEEPAMAPVSTPTPTVITTESLSNKMISAGAFTYSNETQIYDIAGYIFEASTNTYETGHEHAFGFNYKTGEISPIEEGTLNTGDIWNNLAGEGYQVLWQTHPEGTYPNYQLGTQYWQPNPYDTDDGTVVNSTGDIIQAWNLRDSDVEYLITVRIKNGRPYDMGVININLLRTLNENLYSPPQQLDTGDWKGWYERLPEGTIRTYRLQ